MIEFTNRTPTIAQIYQYTYLNPKVRNRFEYMERDVLKTKVKITKRYVYRKNKEGKFSTPDEILFVSSTSNPQYYQYNKVKSKGSKKQRKIHHQYDCFFAFSKTKEGEYSFWNSKVIFRIGSQKKWQDAVPQNKIKTILKKTRERIEKKYEKLPSKEKAKAIKKELDKIRSRGKFLDIGDYNSSVNGINGDFYFRDAFIMKKFSCLYGKCYFNKSSEFNFPFFPKHALMIIEVLLKKGIIKYK